MHRMPRSVDATDAPEQGAWPWCSVLSALSDSLHCAVNPHCDCVAWCHLLVQVVRSAGFSDQPPPAGPAPRSSPLSRMAADQEASTAAKSPGPMGRFSKDRPVMPVRPARAADLAAINALASAAAGIPQSSASELAATACFVVDTGPTGPGLVGFVFIRLPGSKPDVAAPATIGPVCTSCMTSCSESGAATESAESDESAEKLLACTATWPTLFAAPVQPSITFIDLAGVSILERTCAY